MSNPAEVGALRAALIGTKNTLEYAAAEFERQGDWFHARSLRQDIEVANAALAGPGALLTLCRDRLSAAAQITADGVVIDAESEVA